MIVGNIHIPNENVAYQKHTSFKKNIQMLFTRNMHVSIGQRYLFTRHIYVTCTNNQVQGLLCRGTGDLRMQIKVLKYSYETFKFALPSILMRLLISRRTTQVTPRTSGRGFSLLPARKGNSKNPRTRVFFKEPVYACVAFLFCFVYLLFIFLSQ